MTNLDEVKALFYSDDALIEDELQDFLTELPYESIDSEHEVPGSDKSIVIHANNTSPSRDSYGYAYLEDGLIVFSLKDEPEINYGIPYSYSSYENWSWNINKIKVVELKEKVITLWEWV